jgi:CUE domain
VSRLYKVAKKENKTDDQQRPAAVNSMSISYEEALATLQSMFGEPWTRETLDAVLRHQQGHMENTVDLVLRHGDRAPQVLVDQLQSGIDPQTQAMNADAQLARQISQQEQQLRSRSAARPGAAAKKGRGTPTTLPEDFLRLPNAAGGAAPRLSQMEQDEALARML